MAKRKAQTTDDIRKELEALQNNLKTLEAKETHAKSLEVVSTAIEETDVDFVVDTLNGLLMEHGYSIKYNGVFKDDIELVIMAQYKGKKSGHEIEFTKKVMDDISKGKKWNRKDIYSTLANTNKLEKITPAFGEGNKQVYKLL